MQKQYTTYYVQLAPFLINQVKTQMCLDVLGPELHYGTAHQGLARANRGSKLIWIKWCLML